MSKILDLSKLSNSSYFQLNISKLQPIMKKKLLLLGFAIT